MDLNCVNCVICEITKKTFEVIKKVYDHHNEYVDSKKKPKTTKDMASSDVGSRIIFPRYYIHKKGGEKEKRKDYNRISEQELRFIFVEQLNKYADQNNIDIYYSVETPTKNAYRFSSENKDAPKVDNENGVSARTDLTIYEKEGDKFTKKALIEFKALNPVIENYEKDFCKLNNEEETSIKYFIQIIKNYNAGTIESIREKIKSKGKDNNIIYKCYCLDEGKDITTKITPDEKCESKSTAESTK